MKKTAIIIPTYNEANNLPAMVDALLALGIANLEILVVDDNSPDGTGQLADELALSFPGVLHVLHRPGKQGLGTAYIQGFNWALARQSDFIIQMDADFSHSPQYIPQMLAAVQDCDVVVGSRYVPGGRLDEHWGWGRWFLSWWANSIWVRLILGLRTRDATAGFKCWRADGLHAIGLHRVHSNGYIFQVEMCYLAEKMGLKIQEIPIYFEDRHIGRSKMSMRIKVEAALRVFEIRWRYRNLARLATETNLRD